MEIKAFGPIRDGQVAAHPTQGCAGGNGLNSGQSMASSLGTVRIGNIGKKVGQGLHLLCTEHDFWISYTISGFEDRPDKDL